MKHLILILTLLAVPAFAVQPHEMLDEPVLEARAQQLDDELRCVRCRSESIASSNADWASDARVIVRELLTQGATDAEVKAFFVERYGEYVLMRPPLSATNIALWLAGPVLFLGVLGVLVARRRGGSAAVATADALTPEEKARLDALTKP